MERETLLNEYQFKSAACEKESQVNFDISNQTISLYTSHNATARKIHKRIGAPVRKDSYGAQWILSMKEYSKIPMGTFLALRKTST